VYSDSSFDFAVVRDVSSQALSASTTNPSIASTKALRALSTSV